MRCGWLLLACCARDPRDCPIAVSPEQNRPMTDAEPFGYGGTKKLVNRVTGAAHAVQAGAEVLTDPAKLSTLAEHTREKAGHLAQQALQAVRDPHKAKEAAADFIEDAAKGAHQNLIDFKDLPRGKQIEVAGGVLLNGALDLTAGAIVGSVLSTSEKTVEAVDDVRKLAKTAAKKSRKGTAEEVAEHTDEAAARRLLKDARERAERAESGRGANHLKLNERAQGPHSTFKTDSEGRVTGHAEWQPNAYNPHGMQQVKRVDTQYANPHTHHNGATGQEVRTPHVHEKSAPGGVRPARPDELPR